MTRIPISPKWTLFVLLIVAPFSAHGAIRGKVECTPVVVYALIAVVIALELVSLISLPVIYVMWKNKRDERRREQRRRDRIARGLKPDDERRTRSRFSLWRKPKSTMTAMEAGTDKTAMTPSYQSHTLRDRNEQPGSRFGWFGNSKRGTASKTGTARIPSMHMNAGGSGAASGGAGEAPWPSSASEQNRQQQHPSLQQPHSSPLHPHGANTSAFYPMK